VDNLVREIENRFAVPKKNKGRILITTLTKKMAEDLAAYLEERKLKVTYLHSDVKTLDRIRILTSLRKGEFDVLVGVNLLREGLDLPEVSLVAILDADKEGFLRSETSLIQTIGRAARNLYGEVLIYADNITGSIKRAVEETDRRRKLQLEYNKKHGITPKTIVKKISDIVPAKEVLELETKPLPRSKKAIGQLVRQKEKGVLTDYEIASIQHISRMTVYRLWDRYCNFGVEALKEKPIGRKVDEIPNKIQEDILRLRKEDYGIHAIEGMLKNKNIIISLFIGEHCIRRGLHFRGKIHRMIMCN